MRRARTCALLALCGCGDNERATVDAGIAPCTARFTGNFDETANAPDCAKLVVGTDGTTAIALTVPSAKLGTQLAISIDLGPSPTTGTFTSETVTTWKALATARVGNSACYYSAGSTAVPPGSFELALGSLDVPALTASGTLSLTQYILPFPGTTCGDSDTEHLALEF